VKWSPWVRERGSAAPAKFGGHRTCTLEAHRDFLLAHLEAVSHLTLHRLKDLLAGRAGLMCLTMPSGVSCGAKVGPAKESAFASRPHRPTSPGGADLGRGRSIIQIRNASSSSTRSGSRATWLRSAAQASKVSG
jgi:hypothetical protein